MNQLLRTFEIVHVTFIFISPYESQKWNILAANSRVASLSLPYVGKHLTLRGGSDLDKIFQGGGFFLAFCWGGDRFFDLKGGDIL